MEKKVFIFDLYGTLVDIHTDEQQKKLWEMLADCYKARGVFYKAKEIEERYQTLVNEETGCLRALTRNRYAEIELSHVFGRLLYEHPSYNPANDPFTKANSIQEIPYNSERIGLTDIGNEITLSSPDDLDLKKKYDPWIIETAWKFRTASRELIKLFEDTVPVLRKLKEQGKKVYLLSNAQTLFTVPEMKECDLISYFDGIFISSEQKIKKPGKAFMERLLRDFEIERDEAVMIGNDMTSDIRSAMESGITGVFLNTDQYTSDQVKASLEEQKRDYQRGRILRGEISENEYDPIWSYTPKVIMSGCLSELFDVIKDETEE